MATYIVAFEVNDDDRKEKFKEYLRSYGTYCPINANCWAIKSQHDSVKIRDHLNRGLDPNDRVFVIRSGLEAAWRNAYSDDNSKWLREHLSNA